MFRPFRTTLLTTLVAGLLTPLSAEVVVVGKFSAKIVPEQVANLSFNGKGSVTDLLKDTSKRIEKDTIVGVLDKEKTEEAREDLELQLERERFSKQDEIRKHINEREKLAFYLKLSERERAYAKDVRPEEGKEVSQEALRDINRRIELAERELNTMERRKRAEFEAKHAPNTLRMPFTGRLQYNFSLPENLDEPFEYTNLGGRAFATVCDDSAFYITVNINDTDLTLLPEHQFSAYIALPGGKRLPGTYSFRRVERGSSSGDILAYFFKVNPEDHEMAYNMLGSSASAWLVYTPEEGVEMVKKIDLLQHPAAPECEDWKQLVALAYPGYVIVLTTERHILIRKQPEQNS